MATIDSSVSKQLLEVLWMIKIDAYKQLRHLQESKELVHCQTTPTATTEYLPGVTKK